MLFRNLAVWAACALCLQIVAPLRAQDEAIEVYRRAHPSVVQIESSDGFGSGTLISAEGLVLTNAHVVVAPLHFRCIVQVQRGEESETVVFERVQILGFHPQLDLALLQLDLQEHPGVLRPVTMCQEEVATGERVFAIGNPSRPGLELSNSITQGILSSVDREVEGQRYFQFDAAINPGNSGGPLCNTAGEAIGLVSFKLTDAESIGFAIPLRDFDPEQFVPLNQRALDRERSNEFAQLGNDWHARTRSVARDRGEHNEEDIACYERAIACYQLAILYDPTSPTPYHNAGVMLGALGREESSVAYFHQTIRLIPWATGPDSYHYLGKSLVDLGRTEDAITVWQEGVAKYPLDGAKIWEDLAIAHGLQAEPYAAAYAARAAMALEDEDVRQNVVAEVFRLNFAALSEEDQDRLEAETEELRATLRRRTRYAASQEGEGVLWMTNEFEEYLREGE